MTCRDVNRNSKEKKTEGENKTEEKELKEEFD